MEYNDDEAQVRQIVERKLNFQLTDIQWAVIKPHLGILPGRPLPHFEEDDKGGDISIEIPNIRATLKAFNKYVPSSDKALKTVLKKAYKPKGDTISKEAHLLSEVFRTNELINIPEVQRDLSRMASLREGFFLGLGSGLPIKLRHIKNWLIEMGATENPPGYTLPYPVFKTIFTDEAEQTIQEAKKLLSKSIMEKSLRVSDIVKPEQPRDTSRELKQLVHELKSELYDFVSKKIETRNNGYDFAPIDFWDINYLYVPHQIIERFEPIFNSISDISIRQQCHQALALACLLCDLPLYPPKSIKLEIIREGNNIQIYSNSTQVSPKVIARQYREIRRHTLRSLKDLEGWPRPRSPRLKTRELYNYCSEYSKKNWESIRLSWNNKYPAWRFDNNKKMQIAYYKAKSRIEKQI